MKFTSILLPALFSFVCVTAQIAPDANGILYVKKGSTGTGSSWASPVGELADALKAARTINTSTPGKVKELWVAAGTYKPMYSPDDLNFGVAAGRHNSFRLLPTVAMYGGFAGSETTLSQRNYADNATILSGDLDNNGDVSNSDAYHVLVAAGSGFPAMRLDGFTVTGGNANVIVNLTVGGRVIWADNGGGLSMASATLEVFNCRFTNNKASNLGAAMLFNEYPGSTAKASLANNLFTGNKASEGGALFCNNEVDLQAVNNTFYRDTATNANSGGVFAGNTTTSFFYNNIYWQNQPANYAGTGPGGSNNLITDPKFEDAAAERFTLMTGSEAINSGDKTRYLSAFPTLDLSVSPRLIDEQIDRGAFEYQHVLLSPDMNGRLYIKQNGAGNMSGNSWANAAPEVADALKTASLVNAVTPGKIKDIWVAAGTYKPKYTPEDGQNFSATPADSRDRTFLLEKGVNLYGGFAGIETELAQRNWQTNVTTLSGDFNGDDLITGSGASLEISNNVENAYHVIIGAGDLGGLNLSGFAIRGGCGGNKRIDVKSLAANGLSGGGLYLNFANNASFQDISMRFNKNDLGGGASLFYCNNIKLKNAIVETNSALRGGGILSIASAFYVEGVRFDGNSGSLDGGGCYISNSSSETAVFSNCVFSGNSAPEGAGLNLYSGNSQFVNVTVAGNGIGNQGLRAFGYSYWKNSIIWDGIQNGSFSLENCLVKDFSSTANGNLDATGLTADMLFVDSTNGDFRLKAGSPAINTGSNSLLPNPAPATDLKGNQRIVGGIVDMGAYEYQDLLLTPDISGRLYIKQNGAGNMSGNSWANAAPEVADALKTAILVNAVTPGKIKDIWVAAGTYKPKYTPEDGQKLSANPADSRDRSFLLEKGVNLYGGFAGTETELAQRNWQTNVTTLSGDFNGDDLVNGTGLDLVANNTENAYHVVVGVGDLGSLEVSGFTVRGGSDRNCIDKYPLVKSVDVLPYVGGGMHLTATTNGTFTELKIILNRSYYGGGVFAAATGTTLKNIVLEHNTGILGGGLCAGHGQFTADRLHIRNNFASNYGGGFYSEGTSLYLSNSVLTGNLAQLNGHAIYHVGAGDCQFSNLTTAGNGYDNRSVYASGQSTVKNSIIWDDVEFPFFKNSLYKGSINTNNGGFDATGLTADMLFVDSANGDFRLKAGSPAINKGYNALLPQPPPATDLDGQPRIVGGTVDLGAYEFQGRPDANGILYVKKGSSGNGSSWASPLGEVADALALADTYNAITPGMVQQIWVAAGTYLPLYTPADNQHYSSKPADLRDRSFMLVKDVQLYGGFAGTETDISQRNWQANASILSGDMDNSNTVSNGDAYHVFVAAGDLGTALLNGFTLKTGNSNGTGSVTIKAANVLRSQGAELYNASPNLVVDKVEVKK